MLTFESLLPLVCPFRGSTAQAIRTFLQLMMLLFDLLEVLGVFEVLNFDFVKVINSCDKIF